MTAVEASVPSERVPFIDMAAVNGPVRDALRAAFERVLASGDFGSGAEVSAFERELGQAVDARHVVGVSSGTSALSLSFVAAGIGCGDEVLVPANTFFATAGAVVAAGATPVAVEIEPRSGLIDLDAAVASITARTAALAVVHLYGNPVDMGHARRVAAGHGLLLVEDAAQALGASWDGEPVGSLADVSTFSFYPTKNLGALGQGGAVCTEHGDIAESIRQRREQGTGGPGLHVVWAGNDRLHELQAAFLRAKLASLHAAQGRREIAAARYEELLRELPGVRRYVVDDRGVHAHHLFAVSVDRRDDVRRHLARSGVATGVHYPRPIHRQPAWRSLAAVPDLPHADRHAATTLSLPFWPGIDEGTIGRVVEELSAAAPRATGTPKGAYGWTPRLSPAHSGITEVET